MSRKLVGPILLVLGGLLLAVGCAPATTGAATATQTFEVVLGEGEVIGEVDGKDQLTGEFHRWEPAVLVAHVGDKIVLTVKNPRKNAHSLAIMGYAQDTGSLAPRTGEKTLEFVADKAGVFPFVCSIPFDEASGNCDPDHARMVGHLIVLNK